MKHVKKAIAFSTVLMKIMVKMKYPQKEAVIAGKEKKQQSKRMHNLYLMKNEETIKIKEINNACRKIKLS